MAEMYAIKKDDLTDIADAIRSKRGIADMIPVGDMAMQIGLIGGGGLDYIEGEITIDTATNEITFPKKAEWDNFIVIASRAEHILNVNGANGVLFIKNYSPVRTANQQMYIDIGLQNCLHVVNEARTTYADYEGTQANIGSLRTFDIGEDYLTVPCRHGGYPFCAGTYKYIVIGLN